MQDETGALGRRVLSAIEAAGKRGASSSAMGEAFLRFAETATGEDIEARIRGVVTHPNALGYDPFGFDPDVARHVLAVAAILHRLYFRTEVHGIEHIPEGRVLVIANHSGQLPLDGVMIAASLMLDANPPRFPRSMVEKWTAELPFVSTIFPRAGQVVGSPDNARRLLLQEESIIVFPEGAKGISKTFDQRYQLTEFGLGFMRLALETKTPIVPCAVIGAEEQYPSVADVAPLAKLLGMPAFPLIPQLLFGMVLPLPTKYRLYFGEPLRFDGDPDDDDAIIDDKVARVKTTIETMLREGLAARQSIFY